MKQLETRRPEQVGKVCEREMNKFEKLKKECYTKSGDTTKSFYLLQRIKEERVLHLKRWTRSGSRYKLDEKSHDRLYFALRYIGIDFMVGNDAQRGGAEGDYIMLTQKGSRQLAQIWRLL